MIFGRKNIFLYGFTDVGKREVFRFANRFPTFHELYNKIFSFKIFNICSVASKSWKV